MKVVQVNDTFVPGRGIDRVIYEIGKRMDVDLTVIASRIEYDIPGAEMIEMPVKKSVHPVLWMIRGVRDYVKKNPDSAFHFHHMVLNWALTKSNTLCTFHGWSPEEIDRNFIIMRKFRQKFLELTAGRYAKADKVSAVNAYQIPLLSSWGVKNPVHIPNGVDVARFKPDKRDDGYMLFVGRLTDQKRPDELIQLSHELGFPLHMVGSGPLEEDLVELAESLSAPVKFFRKLSEDELIKQYQHSSFFISASLWEGMTLTVPEAYACGKPAVVYDIPAMQDFNIGHRCNDYEGLKESARQLIDDAGKRKELGEMARGFAERNLSWETIVQKYLRMYEAKI